MDKFIQNVYGVKRFVTRFLPSGGRKPPERSTQGAYAPRSADTVVRRERSLRTTIDKTNAATLSRTMVPDMPSEILAPCPSPSSAIGH